MAAAWKKCQLTSCVLTIYVPISAAHRAENEIRRQSRCSVYDPLLTRCGIYEMVLISLASRDLRSCLGAWIRNRKVRRGRRPDAAFALLR